jgi:hypothetical protein
VTTPARRKHLTDVLMAFLEDKISLAELKGIRARISTVWQMRVIRSSNMGVLRRRRKSRPSRMPLIIFMTMALRINR